MVETSLVLLSRSMASVLIRTKDRLLLPECVTDDSKNVLRVGRSDLDNVSVAQAQISGLPVIHRHVLVAPEQQVEMASHPLVAEPGGTPETCYQFATGGSRRGQIAADLGFWVANGI